MTPRRGQGLLMVFTGNGKGKTTAAFGQALRAIGHGKKVLVIQFMKGSENYGEIVAARKYLGGILEVEQHGRDSFVSKESPAPEDIQLAREGLSRAADVLARSDYGLVVLDELNVAIDFGLVSAAEVQQLLDSRDPSLDVIVTGRYAPASLVQQADLVSEVLDIKHHFADGVPAREGIEF